MILKPKNYSPYCREIATLCCPHVRTCQLIKNARAYQSEHIFIDGNVSTLWPRISIASAYKF